MAAKHFTGATPQHYPRRKESWMADDSLFPRSRPISLTQLRNAICRSFERSLKTKTGKYTPLETTPEKLVDLCFQHLKERSDPILNPAFLSTCSPEEVFEMDAISYEMQRHRMRIGNFYQFLIIALMKETFSTVFDGKREGDVEAEIDPPSFPLGLRLYISVKKSSDTVGGQDIGGVISRLETIAKEDKNLTRPYMCVVAIATPHKGIVLGYEDSRSVRCRTDGTPYSPNCEIWHPGFIFPYICGREAHEVYKEALKVVGDYYPFHSIAYKKECADLLASRLRSLGIVNAATGKIDAEKFQDYITQKKALDQTEG